MNFDEVIAYVNILVAISKLTRLTVIAIMLLSIAD
jgi:hypothetical protein